MGDLNRRFTLLDHHGDAPVAGVQRGLGLPVDPCSLVGLGKKQPQTCGHWILPPGFFLWVIQANRVITVEGSGSVFFLGIVLGNDGFKALVRC